MVVYAVEIDIRNNDEWQLLGVFSSEEIADKEMDKMGLLPIQRSTTKVYVDELNTLT